jgi:hypothetical protein
MHETPAEALARLVNAGRCRAPSPKAAAAWKSREAVEWRPRLSLADVRKDIEALDAEGFIPPA